MTSQNDRNLWEELRIFFRLESDVISDNKITGSLNFTPEHAFKLIKNFELITSNGERIEFNRDYRKIVASGFDPSDEKLWVQIKALPYKEHFEPKLSDPQHFSITHQRFPWIPTTNLCWSNSTNNKPTLIVRWFHIRDKLTKLYVLSLDGKEIYYAREPSQYDAYEVTIKTLEPGSKHTVEIIGRSENGKETYRSDELKVDVPYNRPEDNNYNNNKQTINVSQAQGPADALRDIIDEYISKSKTVSRKRNSIYQSNRKLSRSPPSKTPSPPPVSRRTTVLKSTSTKSCGCRHPHTTFPGLMHYFNNGDNNNDDDDDVVVAVSN